MKILLFSALLALAAANAIPADQSDDQNTQKPGMCFEDFFRKHHDEIEKFKKKMSESSGDSLDPAGHRPGPPPDGKHGPHTHHEDGVHHHRKPKPGHMIDFSKLKNCTLDQDCDNIDKCCSTPCGMRCTKPFFEDHMSWKKEHHRHGETANKRGDEEEREKHQDSDKHGDRSDKE
ncbi:hypothetical protein NDU88_000402 [Pleurodeles waltl]|uniref:WAP domain-containing protein n=1 Tax=Pleurodeles waltl TaxID=8319 RepID=A0AAV7P5L5_PLEWA|nr:hypothetical protein NDU88_000402 [Pleurodeles waltl]